MDISNNEIITPSEKSESPEKSDTLEPSESYTTKAYNYVTNIKISNYWIAIIIIGIIAIIAIIFGAMYIHSRTANVITIPPTSVPCYYINAVTTPPGNLNASAGSLNFTKGYWQVNIYSYINDTGGADNLTPPDVAQLSSYMWGLSTIDAPDRNYINGSGATPSGSQTSSTGVTIYGFSTSDESSNWSRCIQVSPIFVNINKAVTYYLVGMTNFSSNSEPKSDSYITPFVNVMQATAVRLGNANPNIPYSS